MLRSRWRSLAILAALLAPFAIADVQSDTSRHYAAAGTSMSYVREYYEHWNLGKRLSEVVWDYSFETYHTASLARAGFARPWMAVIGANSIGLGACPHTKGVCQGTLSGIDRACW